MHHKEKPHTQADKNREKANRMQQMHISKKEERIDKLSQDQVKNELKDKGLPVFGTKVERQERLKKAYGIQSAPNIIKDNFEQIKDTKDQKDIKGTKQVGVVAEIEKIKQKREERRLNLEKKQVEKDQKKEANKELGFVCDIDFELMIQKERFQESLLQPHSESSKMSLSVNVRKRPIFPKEKKAGEIDSVSAANPEIKIHEPKLKVDGISKYIQNHCFTFDNTFNENEETNALYKYSLKCLIDNLFQKCVVTVFAYGQTGSGKTYTMKGIQNSTVKELFEGAKKLKHEGIRFYMSFYEIYGGKCFDLLNKNCRVQVLEDKNNEIQIHGLTEHEVGTEEEMHKVIEFGHQARTTHCTTSNDTSSRSHALCQVHLKNKDNKFLGKLHLVDLAGSERAQDTQSNNRQRRLEGAEINKSLLAQKECIRAMNSQANHVPFRASKLTLALRDSFVSKNFKSYILMIACICPGSTSADHSLNTLRYADRLKNKDKFQPEEKKNPVFLPQVSSNRQSAEKEITDRGGCSNSRDDDIIESSLQAISQTANYLNNLSNEKLGKENKWQTRNLENVMPPIRPQIVKQNKFDSNSKKNLSADSDKLTNINQKIKEKESIFKQPKKKFDNCLKNDRSDVNITKERENKHLNKKGENYDHESIDRLRDFYLGEEDLTKENPKNKTQNNCTTEGVEDEAFKKSQKENDAFKKSEKEKVKRDIDYMRSTIKVDHQQHHEQIDEEEYFAFQEKVNDLFEMHDEVLAQHMNILKEDAVFLTRETEIYSKAQKDGFDDNVENYIGELDEIVKKKLFLYQSQSKRIFKFKKNLKEEEEISSKFKGTFYYQLEEYC